MAGLNLEFHKNLWGHVALSYCLLGFLISIALCANVLELLTKFYPCISDINRGNLVQVYNTYHKLLKQKPFLLNVLENFIPTFTFHTFVLAQMAPLLP